MNIVTVYYSFTGKTRKLAEEIAQKRNTDICEIKDQKKPGLVKAYIAGSLSAMRGKGTPIQSLCKDLNQYDKIILLAPVWASNPAPAMNSVIETLPGGKKVEVMMISASGKSKCKDKLTGKIKKRGSVMISFKDVKA